ncbi:MAG: sulfurtransferase complex subunit TusD [Halioglobus sp.]
MIYSLLVLSSPASGQTARSAALFAQAVLEGGHSIERVFFMDEGSYAGDAHRVQAQDEPDPMALWVSLAEQHRLDLVLCVSSAIKRGLLDQSEADRYEKSAASVHPAFVISGLGQLVDASAKSDRLITFGG